MSASMPPTDGEGQAISLRKDLQPQPLLEGESGALARGETVELSRGRRAVAAAATARDKTIGQLVALLVPLIRATRFPLLAVVLVAAVPALLVIVIALLRPGPDDGFWLVLAAAGLVVAGWLELRRRQLLAVASDPASLADAVRSVVTGQDLWDNVIRNVGTARQGVGAVGAAVKVRRSRPVRVLKGMWRGVQLTGVLTQITDRPELAPLLPGRLRGLWFLVIACLITALVLGLAVLVSGLLYLLGA
jgi:hypothetical protein